VPRNRAATLIRLLVVLASGAVAAAALPPLDIVPGLFGLAGLAWGVRLAETGRGAALAGWVWAFGYHVAGLYWISNALFVNGTQHAWLTPFAIAGLPALLGLFTAAGCWASRAATNGITGLVARHRGLSQPIRDGVCGWLLLVVCVSLTEWLRGHVLTGFPWNLPGYGWDSVPAMLQVSSVIGIYGLTLLTLLGGTAPALLIDRATSRRSVAVALVAVTGLLLAVGVWGGDRLATENASPEPGVVVRVVQGNVPQRDKWNPLLRPTHLRRYLDLSVGGRAATVRTPGLRFGATPTVVVWPETAVAHLLSAEKGGLEQLGAVLPEDGTLIFGAPRVGERPDPDSPPPVYNSVFAVDRAGAVQWVFDKAHLVPFGEYVPFRGILPIEPVVQGKRDFSAGPGPLSLPVAGAPAVSPLVCYEAIFPGKVVNAEGDRPGWLLNLTNDAWFGQSAGPYQHLAISRLRAVEEGIPMIRAANTGVSAVIDPYGRILARLELLRTGTIDAWLPQALKQTPYAMFGDLFYFLVCALLFSFGALHPLLTNPREVMN